MNIIGWFFQLISQIFKPTLPTPKPTPVPVPEPTLPTPQPTPVPVSDPPPIYLPPVPTPPAPPLIPGIAPASSIIEGIDVSTWQGHIDYAAAKTAGIVFTIMKATEGTSFVDPRFDENFRDCVGFEHRGIYHFARPDLWNSPEAEADFFCMIVKNKIVSGDFVALDMELGFGNLLDWSLRWLRRVYANLGFRPMIYSYWSFFENHGLHDNAELAQYGLWLADWNIPVPPVVPGWAFIAVWQKSNSGSVPGVPARVDLDEFTGDVAHLVKYGKP